MISLVAFPITASLSFGQVFQNANEPILPFVFLWLTLLFTTVFTTITSFIREAETKTIIGLKALPCSPSTLYLSKFLFTLILNTVLGFTTLGFTIIFIGFETQLLLEFYLLLLLEVACLSAISSFASAITMQSEGKTLLLPFLFFLFSLPSVTAAMVASEKLGSNLAFVSVLMLIVAYTILIVSLSTFLLRYLLED